MARPRKDSGEVPVRERLSQAFWGLFEERPLSQITVGDLAQRARCNRGTFYYYYDTLEDLARAEVDKLLLAELFRDVLSHLSDTDFTENVLNEIPNLQVRLRRICLVTGDHSLSEIADHVKQTAAEVWAEVLGMEDGLTYRQTIVFEFIFGGLMNAMNVQIKRTGSVQMTFFDAVPSLAKYLPAMLMEALRPGEDEVPQPC